MWKWASEFRVEHVLPPNSGARIVSRQGGMFSRYPWTGYRLGICGLPHIFIRIPQVGRNQRPIKVAPRSISFVLQFCSRLGNRMKDEAFFDLCMYSKLMQAERR
ncbi:hypothetical protein DET56_10429 [Paenibacillus pabuli]|uniref:Uncharacterized protein n=1 Tax=Paenibacillus pabuli TaxID=1472 RepID=A0A855Y9Q6_9BACL|nr:hypothetical protein DET56_10429 [Paenibacillus pabuli]PXW07364.1 hypothetical protein DEU73_10529 [Paenibacillus taichungensis]